MSKVNRIAWLVLLIAGVPARAEEKDKSSYTLFQPVPAELMRELATDRPDVTESPYTVDAGHVQVELSFIEYTYDDDGARTDAVSVLPINLKVGLLNNADLQLLVSPYVNVRTRQSGVSRRDHGIGETELRLKVNLWGNDGGDTAFGVMPFVRFPTAADDLGAKRIEGGLILPLSVSLPHDWELSGMLETDVVRDEANRDYGVELVHTVSVGHKIWGPLSGFVEYVGIAPVDTGRSYIAQTDVGLTYEVSENVQLDAAMFFGLSRAADDVTFLMGLSFRL